MSATSFNPDIITISKQLIEYTEALAPATSALPQAGSLITKAALQRIDPLDRSLKPLLEQVQQIVPANAELSKAVKACEEAPTFDNVRHVTALCMRQCPDDVVEHFLGLDVWKQSATGNVDEACREIIECFKKQSSSLNLGSLSFASLPGSIFYYLPKLKTVVCDGNKITALSINTSSLQRLLNDNIAQLQELATDEMLRNLQFSSLKADASLLASINDWIKQLQYSINYQNKETCSVVCNRVLTLLSFAQENREYREVLTDLLTDTRRDATLKLLDLEYHKKIIECKDSVPIILDLLKGCFIIEELGSFAKNFFDKNPRTNEIDIHLDLQLTLKDKFNLPIDVQAMNFFGSFELTSKDVEEANQQVQAALNDENKLLTYFTYHQLWPKWQEALQKEYAAEYEQAMLEIHEAIEKLEEEKETISSQEYVQRLNSIIEASKGWAKKKTLEIISEKIP